MQIWGSLPHVGGEGTRLWSPVAGLEGKINSEMNRHKAKVILLYGLNLPEIEENHVSF